MTLDYIFTPKNAKKRRCIECDFICSKQSDWDRHIMTLKHQKSDNGLQNDDKKTPKNAALECVCDCGKIYKYRQGLSKHRKTCTFLNNVNANFISTKSMDALLDTKVNNQVVELCKNSQNDFKDIIIMMMKENKDFQKTFLEMVPNMTTGTVNSHNTNSNNTNNFNIQMFLNDHCKNAMNLTDFIQSLPITSETYDNTIENGLTKTITNMMVNGLNELDILKRPIHCTDASRKILYVKDADKWEKDNELLHIMKGIKELSLKQRTLISKWKEANSGWDKDDILQSKMTNLVFNSMTQIEDDNKETNKIIRTISKSVYLDNDTKRDYTRS
jgi:hypothetical protein